MQCVVLGGEDMVGGVIVQSCLSTHIIVDGGFVVPQVWGQEAAHSSGHPNSHTSVRLKGNSLKETIKKEESCFKGLEEEERLKSPFGLLCLWGCICCPPKS